MRGGGLQRSLHAYAADSASGGILEFRDAGDSTISQSSGAGSAADEDRLGSIPKSFVATALLGLVAQGKVSLTDTVEHWLPGLVPRSRCHRVDGRRRQRLLSGAAAGPTAFCRI
jgi:D-alanyl-D-alanine carboxypeptidase